MDMYKQNGPIDEALIASAEEFWNLNLPREYKEFLIKYNGGIPNKTAFFFKNKEEGSILTLFYGFKKGDGNILVESKEVGTRYLKNMLPIADDACGNRILISVKGPDRGKIYFWDHEMEVDPAQGETPNYSNLTLVADSFDEFINNLRDEIEN